MTFDFVFSSRRGTFSLQLLVVLVPVFFGLMGFAVDLGRLYLIKGELNQAASAMALAAASQLIGNAIATDNATTAAAEIVDDTTGHAARYNFGADIIGQTTGLLNSTVNPPSFYATMADATGALSNGASGNQADTTTARHVQVTLAADAPLLFWSFLSLGQQRTTPVGAVAVAGISSPLCVACGIEPFAIQAVDSTDPQDFGYVYGSYYTFAYQCTTTAANPLPQPLLGTLISYILIDHYDPANTVDDETQQLYLAGASGLLPAPASDQTAAGLPMSCITIGSAEVIWGTSSGGTLANPSTCGGGIPTVVEDMLCGMYSRLDTTQSPPTGCTNNVTDAGNLAAAFLADIDVNDPGGDYTAYAGNGRRIITVPIVDAFGTLDVLGFRQFLVVPNPDGSGNFDPTDVDGRFVVMYMGMSPADSLTTPAPVRQGSIAGCQNGFLAGQGPGKVVLHQ